MNAIAYIRVSTDGQCKEDKFGLDAQKKMIKDYCKNNDYTIVKWVSDEGESGAKERPGFDSIIYEDDIANPPYDAVIVAKSDRVARDINVYYYYKMMLRKKGVTLISISEDFGQFGVFASFLEAFTLCVAEMERDNIAKRTAGGRRLKANAGGYSGGQPPMGYHIQNGEMVIDEKEAKVVRRLFELADEGKNIQEVQIAINLEGYVSRQGRPFAYSSVRSILNNRKTYEGMYKYGDCEWVQGKHEPILK